MKSDVEAEKHQTQTASMGGNGIPLVRETLGTREYAYYPLGEHIVSAPGVCGGRPVFKYTRIDARHVWNALRAGQSMDQLVAAYAGRISREAIDEVVQLVERHGPEFLEVPHSARERAA